MDIHDKLAYYKYQVIHSDKFIEKIIGEEITDYSISSSDSGLSVQFKYKRWKFTLTHKSVNEQLYDATYTRLIDTLILDDGLDNDEFFNLSMERDICVFLKTENILMIRKYIKEATTKYMNLVKQLEKL